MDPGQGNDFNDGPYGPMPPDLEELVMLAGDDLVNIILDIEEEAVQNPPEQSYLWQQPGLVVPETPPASPAGQEESDFESGEESMDEDDALVGQDVTGIQQNPWKFPTVAQSAPRKSPALEVYEKRFATFASWPENGVPHPKRMAEAGFYYHGMDTCVTCFYCGCHLENWRIDSDPWLEHAARNPSCLYIRLQKPLDWVESAYRRRNDNEDARQAAFVVEVLKSGVDMNTVVAAVQSLGSNARSAAHLHEAAQQILKKSQTCCICMDQEAVVVFQPCNHLVCCRKCSLGQFQCPVCRAATNSKLRVYVPA